MAEESRPAPRQTPAKATKTAKTAKTAKRTESDAPRSAGSRERPRPRRLAEQAAQQLWELTGKEPEGITGLRRSDDGWIVVVDVLELHRVPETTDVLASYEVEIDEDGELLGYRRRDRFARGSTEASS